jgi:hypothetical protein
LERKPRFKEASYEIRLLYSSLLWNFNKRPNPISRLVLSLFLFLPPVFSRLDVLPPVFSRLDAFYGSSIDSMQNPFSRSKCFPLIRLDLVLHIVSDSLPWVHHSREEGSLDYDGRLVDFQVYLNFNTNIYRQQPNDCISDKSPPRTTNFRLARQVRLRLVREPRHTAWARPPTHAGKQISTSCGSNSWRPCRRPAPAGALNANLIGRATITSPSTSILPHAKLSPTHSSTLYDACGPRLGLTHGKTSEN